MFFQKKWRNCQLSYSFSFSRLQGAKEWASERVRLMSMHAAIVPAPRNSPVLSCSDSQVLIELLAPLRVLDRASISIPFCSWLKRKKNIIFGGCLQKMIIFFMDPSKKWGGVYNYRYMYVIDFVIVCHGFWHFDPFSDDTSDHVWVGYTVWIALRFIPNQLHTCRVLDLKGIWIVPWHVEVLVRQFWLSRWYFSTFQFTKESIRESGNHSILVHFRMTHRTMFE